MALRCGADGAVVASRDSAEAWFVPVVQGVAEVDVVGCGNAFVGGMVAALAAGEGPRAAGAWGAAAASVMLEAEGVPAKPPRELHPLVRQRMAQVAQHTRAVTL